MGSSAWGGEARKQRMGRMLKRNLGHSNCEQSAYQCGAKEKTVSNKDESPSVVGSVVSDGRLVWMKEVWVGFVG